MKTLITLLLICPFFDKVNAQNIAENSTTSANNNEESIPAPAPYFNDSTLPKNFHFQFGILAIPTISKIEVNPMPNGVVEPSTSSVSYSYGAFIQYNFSRNIGVRLDGLYSTISQQYTDRMVERTISLNYYNIPLLLTLNTGVNDPVNVNFSAGPQLNINSGQSMETSGPTLLGETSIPEGVLTPNKISWGAAYGVGVDVALNSNHTTRLGFGYRGFFSVSDMGDTRQTLGDNQYRILGHSEMRTYSLFASFSLAF